MKTILIDVDGVLANMVEPWLDVLYRVTHRSHHVNQIQGFDFQGVCNPHEAAQVWRYIAGTPGWCLGLLDYPGAANALGRLRRLGRVVAVTAPLAESDFWTFERARWLGRRGFRKEDIVFASDKSLVTGDVLIDDGQHNIDAFQGPGMLIARPWNRGTLTLDQTVEALGG